MGNINNKKSGRTNDHPLQMTEQGRAILSAAMQGFLKSGFHGCSMSDIGGATGLSKSSLYHYIEDKQDLAVNVMSALNRRFNEISLGDEYKALYKLKDGAIVALLPFILLETDCPRIKKMVTDYYHRWSEHFIACGDRKSDTFKNFDETSRHYAFCAWIGFWCMAHGGAMPASRLAELMGLEREA